MTITATLALQYTAICAVLGVTMTTVESIWHWRRGNFGETGIWPWYILREDHNPLASAVLTPALDGAGLLALLLVRLAAAILVPVCYGAGLNAGLPLLILIVSQFLLAWRTRLGNEGGDQMTNIMLIMAFLPQALPNEPAIANLAALFVGAQILLSYIASGGAKLFGPKWQRGEALARRRHRLFRRLEETPRHAIPGRLKPREGVDRCARHFRDEHAFRRVIEIP